MSDVYSCNSTFQYASLRKSFHAWRNSPTRIVKWGFQAALHGDERRRSPDSAGVRSALRALQGTQARTQFVQVDVPPRERGRMWSIVSSGVPGRAPQYWQRFRSRLKRLRREKTTSRSGTLL